MPATPPSDWPPTRVAAGVVLYHPLAQARALTDALVGQFDRVFAVENESDTCRSKIPEVEVLRNETNLGLAAADNQLCAAARAAGFEWLVLFDQDSRVPADFRQRLAQRFAALAQPPALLAANYCIELRGETLIGYGSGGGEAVADRIVALHSGSLINLAVHAELGGHDERFFVDHVDHEYCLRLRRHGYRVHVTTEPLFRHEVGQVACTRRFGRIWQSSGHSAARRAEWASKLVLLSKLYWRSDPGWCAAQLFVELPRNVFAMLVLESDRGAKFMGIIGGITRGVFARQRNKSLESRRL